ncbi:MAG TPA: ABC transporter substrate-binding protein [Burkholderiaceae bacterium]|nr:ABC transporter substrate-binding protein [Burkholderiaceae bacterium]
MTLPFFRRDFTGALVLAAAALLSASPARAQDTPIKFQLDWRFEGPAALFLVPEAKGYYKAEKLAVTVDAGNGSGGTVTRVASGAYDMGFADLAALMEFQANNPTAPNKPIAVMMVYNNTPAAVMALKKSGIKTPADLKGKKLGAPVFDAGRKAWPIFAKANGLDAGQWTAMDPTLRETMLVRGDIDAITGFSFTSLLNLEARGVKADDVVVLAYPAYGVKLYGNAVIVSDAFLKKNPEAVKAFLRAFTKGVKDVIADPKAAIVVLKAKDGLVDAALEERRLKLALDATVLTPDAKAEGFGNALGPRLSLMASQVSDAFATKQRVDPALVWNGAFLPAAADRDIFKVAKK